MTSGDRRGLSFPDICLTVEENRGKNLKPGKLTRQGIELGPARLETTILSFVQSGGHILINFLKQSQSHAWYLLSILLLCGIRCIHSIFQVPPYTKIANLLKLEELEATIKRDIDCIPENELIRVNAHFLKRCQESVDEGGHVSCVIIFLRNFNHL